MAFNQAMDNRETGSLKWAALSALLGDDREDGLPMWIAQMDFPPATVLTEAARRFAERGQFGYFAGVEEMYDRVAWWCRTRWGYDADPAHMRATHGLGNAIGLCLQVFSDPGDGVVIFTPVYHEFTNKIVRNNRVVVESPLLMDSDGRFELDLDSLEGRMTGREKIMIISAPHNPAGRIWTAKELNDMAAFCARHDMILISDEIHADLTFPGFDHVPAGAALTDNLDRLIVMTAASKTFDIAGLRTSTVIIPDDETRARFDALHRALDIQPNRAGVDLTCAAFTPEGAAWVDDLRAYLAGNAERLEAGLSALPGVVVRPSEGTFLSWVDFSGTGMSDEEIDRRIKGVGIVPSPGPAFGTGGSQCCRINIGTSRAVVEDAIDRLTKAFGDLQ